METPADAIERLRSQEFKKLPAELLEKICAVQDRYLENPLEARKYIDEAIDQYMTKGSI